jgi:hypothetical protein
MKKSLKNALLSSVFLVALFGPIANGYAQTAPAPAPVSFSAALTPVVTMLQSINHNVDFLLTRATDMQARMVTLVVHANQMVANTNAMNANLNAINANILNISNKANASATTHTEIRDTIVIARDAVTEIKNFFLGGGGGTGLGGISSIPYYDTTIGEKVPRSNTNKKLAELFGEVKSGATFVESTWLTDAMVTISDRFSLEDSLLEATNPTPLEKKEELANSSLLISGLLSAGIAERAYNRSDAAMDRVQGYIDALELSASLKTSLDLNTRVLIDIAQQQNDHIKMMAAFSSMQSQALLASSTNGPPDTDPK